MNKLILSAAIAAVLCTNVAFADDDNNGNPILGTTSSTQVVNTVTNDTVNTVNNSMASRNANRNVNDNSVVSDNTNANNNSLSQGQTQDQGQHQDQNQQQNAYATSTATSASQGGTATANGNGSGNATTINQSYTDSYRERLNPVSTAVGTNLTSGADTCLGSVTGGVQTQILGVSGGKTVVDENCVLIKNTKLLLTMGLPSAACFYVRQDPKIDEAMAAAGVECREPPPVPVEDVPVPSDPATKSAELIRSQYK